MERKLKIAQSAAPYGFSVYETGGHMARSMMLSELTALLGATASESTREDYKSAVVENNLLGKPTFSSRQKTFRHLVELFSLDPSVPLFKELRKFAAWDKSSLPLLAVTCVFCRDIQLRSSFELIERLKVGEVLTR